MLSLQAVVDVWQMFQTQFLQLWDQHSHQGDAYPAALFGGSVKQGQQAHQACLLALHVLDPNTVCRGLCFTFYSFEACAVTSLNNPYAPYFFIATWPVMCLPPNALSAALILYTSIQL